LKIFQLCGLQQEGDPVESWWIKSRESFPIVWLIATLSSRRRQMVPEWVQNLWQNMPDSVSTSWVLAAIGLLVAGKLSLSGFRLIRQTSTGFLMAAILFLSGLGGTGWSVGDVVANFTTPETESLEKGISNKELLAMASESPNVDADTLRQILAYAAVRDSQAVVVVNEAGEVVKVHAMPNQILNRPAKEVQYVTHNGTKEMRIAPASFESTEPVQHGPTLPIQYSLASLLLSLATGVIGVVVASRTAFKVRAEKDAPKKA